MRDEKASRKMAEDGQRGLHIQEIHIKVNKPVKSITTSILGPKIPVDYLILTNFILIFKFIKIIHNIFSKLSSYVLIIQLLINQYIKIYN